MIVKELGSTYNDRVIVEMPFALWASIRKVSSKLFPMETDLMSSNFNIRTHDDIDITRFDAFSDLMYSLAQLTPLELVTFLKDFTNYAEYFTEDRANTALVLRRILER